MRRYRTEPEIIFDILEFIRQNSEKRIETKKTNIMYHAKVSWRQLNVYLTDLRDSGFIREIPKKEIDCHSKNPVYELSPDGREVLDGAKPYFERMKQLK